MEFSKKEIHTSVLTQSKYSQITVDDDFTIPDSKGDMEKIVAKEGHILLESMIPEDGKVRITGSVCVRVLYRTGGDIPRLCQFQSEIPFEDVVNCDGVSSSSQVDCHSQLEDLTVSMINSRKLEVRGLIGTSVNVYEEMCIDAATGIEQGEGVACQSGRARQARCPEGAGGAGNPAEQTEYPGDFMAMCRASEHGDEGGR